MTRLTRFSAAILFTCIAASGAARAQEAEAPPDPAFDAAKAAFEGMSFEDRVLIQRSLVWAVPFNGAALGNFGKLTYNGIKAFEKKKSLEIDGILTSEELAALTGEAEAAQANAKFKIITDKKSGVAIGVSTALLGKRQETPVGVRFANADGSIALETAKGQGTAADLPAAFERFLALPNRKTTYKLLRPDFFVVTGEEGKDSFYIRYAGNESAVRGFTFRYPTAKQKQMDRYVIAAANTFVPFGSQGTPAAISETPAAPTKRFATAVALADGRILAPTAALAKCRDVTVGGKPVTIAAGPDGLSVLSGAGGTPVLEGRNEPAAESERLIALSADPDGAVSVSPGSFRKTGAGLVVEAALQPFASGAAVLDRQGRLVGIVTDDPAAVKPIAGVTPVAQFAFAAISGMAADRPEQSAGAIAESSAKAVLSVSCALAP
jgi:peptidoglycan hydrolase-like protein with peptidoglycan-binding domain